MGVVIARLCRFGRLYWEGCGDWFWRSILTGIGAFTAFEVVRHALLPQHRGLTTAIAQLITWLLIALNRAIDRENDMLRERVADLRVRVIERQERLDEAMQLLEDETLLVRVLAQRLQDEKAGL